MTGIELQDDLMGLTAQCPDGPHCPICYARRESSIDNPLGYSDEEREWRADDTRARARGMNADRRKS